MEQQALILFTSAFATLWLLTYIVYKCYVEALKEKIEKLQAKIYNIERDALLSLVSLAKEKDLEQKKTKDLVELLLKEIKLLFKSNKQAMSLGLTNPNKIIREIAEKALTEGEEDERLL